LQSSAFLNRMQEDMSRRKQRLKELEEAELRREQAELKFAGTVRPLVPGEEVSRGGG
jgi:hypothetical protein